MPYSWQLERMRGPMRKRLREAPMDCLCKLKDRPKLLLLLALGLLLFLFLCRGWLWGWFAWYLVLLAYLGALVLVFERHVSRTLAQDLEVHLKQLLAGIDVDPQGTIATVAKLRKAHEQSSAAREKK